MTRRVASPRRFRRFSFVHEQTLSITKQGALKIPNAGDIAAGPLIDLVPGRCLNAA